jgi:hypothetical protein
LRSDDETLTCDRYESSARAVWRLELTQFREDSAVLVELEREAAAREVSVQQHIYDLLIARYLARQGQGLADLLWLPGGAAGVTDEADAPHTDAATGAAGAWLGMLEE